MAVPTAKRERNRLIYVVILVVVLMALYQGAQYVQKQNWCSAHQASIDSMVQVSGMSSDSACSNLYDRR